MRVLLLSIVLLCPLYADTMVFHGQVYGHMIPYSLLYGGEAGVDELIQVFPGGSVTVDPYLTQNYDEGAWGDTGQIFLPQGATVESLALTYSVDPASSRTFPLSFEPLPYSGMPATNDFSGIGDVDVSYTTLSGEAFTSGGAVDLSFAGDVFIDLGITTLPATPGYYFTEYLAVDPVIDYTLIVTGSVPEPAFFWPLAGLAMCILVGGKVNRTSLPGRQPSK